MEVHSAIGMSPWTVVAVMLTLTALFAYVNHRLLRLPPSIGVMSVALAFSLGLLALDTLGVPVDAPMRALVRQVHFDSTLLHGLLGFLLFAGALSVDLPGLRRNGMVVAVLATVGVVLSAVAVGAGLGGCCVCWESPCPWATACCSGS